MEHEVETRTCGLGVGRIGRLVEAQHQTHQRRLSNPSNPSDKQLPEASRYEVSQGFVFFRSFLVPGFFVRKVPRFQRDHSKWVIPMKSMNILIPLVSFSED